MIDDKWRYNENVSTPPFDRLRVVSVVEPQSWGCLLLGRPAVRLWFTAPSPSADGLGGSA